MTLSIPSKTKALALFALLATGTAQAAESFDWSGFYLGANLGYGWAESNPTTDGFPYQPAGHDKLDSDLSGVVGGGQLGYNWQINRIVLGIEADFSASGISNEDSAGYQDHGANGSIRENNEINSFGTLRARLGFTPAERLLVYATAGWAYGNVDYSVEAKTYTQTPYTTHYKETKSGWAAGAGLEYGISESVTLRAEYLHLDLGDDYDTVYDTYNYEYGWDTSVNIARVGINYLF